MPFPAVERPGFNPSVDSPHATRVVAIRHFNRFYTRLIGVLDEAHLKTGFSLAEARILYELASGEGITASVLSRTLGLDPGYLSRILRGFEDRGLLTKTPSDLDGRRSYLELTADGFVAFETIDTMSQQNIANLISPLGDEQQYRLLESMRTIELLLADSSEQGLSPSLVASPMVSTASSFVDVVSHGADTDQA